MNMDDTQGSSKGWWRASTDRVLNALRRWRPLSCWPACQRKTPDAYAGTDHSWFLVRLRCGVKHPCAWCCLTLSGTWRGRSTECQPHVWCLLLHACMWQVRMRVLQCVVPRWSVPARTRRLHPLLHYIGVLAKTIRLKLMLCIASMNSRATRAPSCGHACHAGTGRTLVCRCMQQHKLPQHTRAGKCQARWGHGRWGSSSGRPAHTACARMASTCSDTAKAACRAQTLHGCRWLHGCSKA